MKAIELSCKVLSNVYITPTVFLLKFDPQVKMGTELTFKPGQFFSVVVAGAGPMGRDLRRAYSIASAPETNHLELCVKVVEGGPGTTLLKNLKAGDVFKGQAPYGDFVYKPKPDARHVVMIATGTGISPFRSMVLSKSFWENPPKSLTLLLGVRKVEEILFDDELTQAAASRHFHFMKFVSQPEGIEPSHSTHFKKGRVTDWLKDHTSAIQFQHTDFYMCGAGAMIDEVKGFLNEKGVEKPCIHQEVYYKTAES